MITERGTNAVLVSILLKFLTTCIVQYFIVVLLLSFEYRFEYRTNIPPTRVVKLTCIVFTEKNDQRF